MTDKTFRLERINKLLQELRYEITRGMMAGDLDETFGFRFHVPGVGMNEMVECEFRTRLIPPYLAAPPSPFI